MKNLQMIEIKYLASTNTKGARIKLIDTRFKCSITLARDYSVECYQQAERFLTDRGFNIVAKCYNEINQTYYLMSDTFESIHNELISNTGYYNSQIVK